MATHTKHGIEQESDVSFPAFEGEPHYVEGYVPCSYDSPHSSLRKGTTWIGMGLILSSVIGIGTWVFALGAKSVGTQPNWAIYAIIGVIIMLGCWIIGAGLIIKGRSDYFAYRKRTGRVF